LNPRLTVDNTNSIYEEIKEHKKKQHMKRLELIKSDSLAEYVLPEL
jgi:hypothetical protein